MLKLNIHYIMNNMKEYKNKSEFIRALKHDCIHAVKEYRMKKLGYDSDIFSTIANNYYRVTIDECIQLIGVADEYIDKILLDIILGTKWESNIVESISKIQDFNNKYINRIFKTAIQNVLNELLP